MFRRQPIVACILAAFVAALSAGQARADESNKRLDIYWVDVEGGAATLIVTPRGESILIDTGNPGQRDPGRIAAVATKVAGLKHLDHVVITHFDGDHFGGAADLSALMPIGTLHDHGVLPQDRKRVGEAYLNFKARRRDVLHAGESIALKQAGPDAPTISVRCLAARKRFLAPSTHHAPNDDLCRNEDAHPVDKSQNANSVVLLVRLGDFEFLDGGDLTWNMERRLVCPVNLVGEVEVYQVDHHGLDFSNNPVLINTVKPTVAVMNNGDKKGCGPATFAALKACPSIKAIYQVHKNLRPDGDVNNTPDAFIANLTPADQCKANYIKLSVDPAGKTYTVSIPANGHEATYMCK